MAPDFRRKRSGDRDDTSSPVLITGARESYRDELAARKKRYFILMSVRIPALLLAAGSLVLWNNPWIAVVGANDRPPLPKGQPRTYTAGRLGSRTPVALPPGLTGGPNTRERPAHDDPAGDRPEDESPPQGGTEPRPRTDTDTDTDESDTTP